MDQGIAAKVLDFAVANNRWIRIHLRVGNSCVILPSGYNTAPPETLMIDGCTPNLRSASPPTFNELHDGQLMRERLLSFSKAATVSTTLYVESGEISAIQVFDHPAAANVPAILPQT